MFLQTGPQFEPTGEQKTVDYGVTPGVDSQAWRHWGGAACEVVEITGATPAQAVTGPCWIYGLRVTAAGTSSTLGLHQGTSSAGLNLHPNVLTATFNVVGYEKNLGFGAAVFCPQGIWAEWGGTGAPRVALFVIRATPG